MIEKLNTKQKISEDLFNRNMEQKVNTARQLNLKQDIVGMNARNIIEKRQQDTYE